MAKARRVSTDRSSFCSQMHWQKMSAEIPRVADSRTSFLMVALQAMVALLISCQYGN
jgi:hypothetical protein